MTTDTDAILSESLRIYYDDLSVQDKSGFERLLQSTFALSSIRNAQLWVRRNDTRRNFINGNLSVLERKIREGFMRGILASKAQESPAKTRVLDDNPVRAGKSLRLYLFDDYTRRNVLEVNYLDGVTAFIYESYGSGVEESNDLDTDEFGDIADQ